MYDRNEVTTASNAEADSRCPGRFQACRGKKRKESTDATFGREIHNALRDQNPRGLTVEQRDIYDSIVAIETAMLAQYFGQDIDNALKFCSRETPIVLPVGDHFHGGTPDAVYRWMEKAMIVEYKTLAGDVPSSPENLQLRDQVVLAQGCMIGVAEVACVVIQPLVTHKPEMCIYHIEDIGKARVALLDRVRSCHAENAPRIAGQVQCQFCYAKQECRSYNGWATERLPVPTILKDMPVSMWTPETRQVFCDHYKQAAKWLKEVEEAMKEGLAKDPEFVPGWHLSEGRRMRTITDMQVLWGRFEAMGGTLETFMKCLELRIGDFEETVAAVPPGLKGKSLKVKLEQLFNGLVDIKLSKPSLEKDE